jgi:hypothetical protein
MVAILAGIAITSENVDTRELDRPVALLQPYHFEQPHHRRQLDRDGDPPDITVIDFQDLHFPLPQQRNGFLPVDDSERFIGGVE